ncbi:sterol desaturase family protein [Rheinheimera sp. NSM]|uniref:sterol desaturase family protein n=1 Tax=Rheinheimera sp. NSM TaxID=3457884 RepID=UPI004037308C
MTDAFEYSLESLSETFYELFLLALLFFLLNLLVKGKKAVSNTWAALPNGVFNLLLMGLNAVVIPPIVSALATLINPHKVSPYLSEMWESSPAIFVIFTTVFVGDFVGYWRHRLEHTRLLWPAHSIHHSDDKMTWLTLQRFHPVNRISTYMIDSFILIALGFPVYAIIANNLVRHYYGYFIHADLPWTYGKWGLLFVSPAMHRWHHAEERMAHNTNYATVFSIFDRVFGTYRVPGVCDVALGVRTIGTMGFVKQMLYPFKLNSYTKPADSHLPEKASTK